MAVISRAGDFFYALRFLRLLTTPFEKTKAFKFGIIDKNGKVLRKSKTLKDSDEKAAYTVFHRLVFNIKRLLAKAPGGSSKLASYAAALFLIKEQTGLSEKQLKKVMAKVLTEADLEEIEESAWFQVDNRLNPGTYILTEDICSPITGDLIALSNSRIRIDEEIEPYDRLFDQNVYKVKHQLTNQEIYITNREIKR